MPYLMIDQKPSIVWVTGSLTVQIFFLRLCRSIRAVAVLAYLRQLAEGSAVKVERRASDTGWSYKPFSSRAEQLSLPRLRMVILIGIPLALEFLA